jgi:hypothetical protein
LKKSKKIKIDIFYSFKIADEKETVLKIIMYKNRLKEL